MLGMLDLAVFILSQCFYFINIRHCFLCFLVMINTCCFLISNQVAKGLHGILPPHEDIRGGGVRGAHLSVPVEVCLFLWTVGELLHMGEVTIRDFPGGLYQFLTRLANAGPKSVKVNLTNCHREVYRIKFYQIATSDVLTSL